MHLWKVRSYYIIVAFVYFLEKVGFIIWQFISGTKSCCGDCWLQIGKTSKCFVLQFSCAAFWVYLNIDVAVTMYADNQNKTFPDIHCSRGNNESCHSSRSENALNLSNIFCASDVMIQVYIFVAQWLRIVNWMKYGKIF